jgi:LEA14-like dessication related protein
MLSGCTGFGYHLEPPRVKLADLEVKEIKVLESVFQVQLRVFNTNEVSLEVKGIECELELNGEPFALGVSNADIEIQPYATEILPVLVYSSVIDMVKGFHGLQKNEQLNYRLKGKIRLGGNDFTSALPFTSEGSLAIKNFPD